MGLFLQLANLLAPPMCVGCGYEGIVLCQGCAAQLSGPPLHCFGCRRPGGNCQPCLTRCGINELRVATTYGDHARRLVHQLKFKGDQQAAQLIAHYLPSPDQDQRSLVTFVPATTQHIRQRGFDQAQLIAAAYARRYRLPARRRLRRFGALHQLGATANSRHKQLTGALYGVGGRSNEQVLLIDDVLTTGATLQAAAWALRQAGVQYITAIVFAQVA